MQHFETAFVVYFLYGLSFFSMGMVLLLENWRMPQDSPQKVFILPLAIFGLMHGAHEWIETLLLALNNSAAENFEHLFEIRLALLCGSFLALAVYGLQACRYARVHMTSLAIIGAITLPAFALIALADVVYAYSTGAIHLFSLIESLVRYLLGVPGAALATIALQAGALKARTDQRQPLDVFLTVSSVGFALYSLTQIFVPAMNTVLASFVNIDVFWTTTSIPIQVVRTLSATIITTGMFNVTRFLETERQQFIVAAQKARLEALEQQEAMRKELMRHIVRAQEEERARIARELHDEMAQTLTAFSLDLATLQQTVGTKSKHQNVTLIRLIERLQDLGKQMSQNMQRMVYDLRPAHLDDLGLAPALKFLSEYEGSRMNLSVDMQMEGESRRLDPLVETVIYRITQESLTNVARHAQTQSARVRLCFQPEEIQLKITDQGIGFNPSQPFPAPRGWGLAGMKERAEAVGGTLKVESAPGQGTSITMAIPYDAVREEIWKPSV